MKKVSLIKMNIKLFENWQKFIRIGDDDNVVGK